MKEKTILKWFSIIVPSRGQLFCLVMTLLLLISCVPPLVIEADQGSWWDTSWMYRKQITIDHTRVAANLTSFPVLIDIVDSDLAAHAQSNGYDIVFTDANGNKLNHEVERYNSSNGHLTAWVRVPSLSSTVDTVLYMYYGNPSASNQQNKTGVWDSNYKMVQHFSQTSGTQSDSTANGNNASPMNGVSEGVTGKIDGADSFDGVDDYLYCANSASLNPTALTLEAWIKPNSITGTHPIIEKYDYLSGYGGYTLRQQDNCLRSSILEGQTGHAIQTTGGLSIGSWYYVVGTFDGSVLKVYINGTLQASLSWTGSILPGTATLKIGTRGNDAAQVFFSGLIDEARVSGTVRNSDWILTEYNNQQTPSSFYTVGAQETAPAVNHPPAISSPSPANGATDIAISLSQLSFDLSDLESDLINYYVTTSPNIGSGSAEGVPSGHYSIPVSGLKNNTTYTWHVNTTDPAGSGKWTNMTFTFTTWVFRIVSASPASRLTCDRTSQQTFEISYSGVANTTWYLNGIQQQYNLSQQTPSWTHTFKDLGIFNVTAVGSSTGVLVEYQWSVQVIINFASGTVQRQTQIMTPSQPWEMGWLFDISVFYEGDVYFCFYSGRPIGQRQIGFAWSYNGVNWTKYSGNPILTAMSGWEGGEVFRPCSLINWGNGTYWLYYNAQGKSGVAFLNIIPDGAGGYTITDLTRYSGNPLISDNYEFTCARYNSTFWIGYTGYSRLDCLTSPDGLHWTYLARGVAPPPLPNGFGSGNNWACHLFFMNDTMYMSVPSNNQYCGMFYCRIGEWTNLTSSPYNPILPNGVGVETYSLGLCPIYDTELDALRMYYIDTLTEDGTGPSGLGLGWIYGVTGKSVAPTISNASPANGAVDIAITLQSLNFSLSNPNGDPMNYTVTTTPDIGSGSGTNVTNGAYSVTVSGLAYSTTYTWTISATDQGLWTYSVFSFTTEASPFLDPFASGWNYRKKIVIDHTKVVGDQADFPVLIKITDLDLASKTQSNGNDIMFMNGTGVALKLKHQIEFYNGTSGNLVAWVKVPHLSSTVDTVLYMYYGNPTCSNQQNPSAVWDPDFVMVQHLSETTGTQYDSTANGNNAVPSGGVSEGVAGKIGDADSFDGVNDYLYCANSASLNPTTVTLEAWIYPNTVSGNAHPVIEKYDWVSGYGGYLLRQNGTSMRFAIVDGETGHPVQTTGGLSIGSWYYVVGTFDGSVLKVYINGTLRASLSWTGSNTASTQSLRIGVRGNALDAFFSGLIDEATVSGTARSAGWIATRYNNMYNPSTFYSVLQEEQRTPVISVNPTTTNATFGTDCTIYINVTSVQDLYAWEFQLNYNPAILNLISTSIVPGGLNEPTSLFYNLTDKTSGHLWWAVSTVHPTTTGISYSAHAIFEITFHTIAPGTANLNLYNTILSNSTGNPITHTVVNGTITVHGFIDLAVTGITIDNHGCSVYRNDTYADGITPYYYAVEVTIRNLGNLTTGLFYVKLEVYWINGSLLETSAEILVSGLAGGTDTLVNFTSLFHPMQSGYYRLTATVDSRNNITETSKVNNTLMLNDIPVATIGDINGDGVVNILDAVIMSQAWQATPGSTQWTIRADINHDGIVNILDAVRIGLYWGETL